MVRIIVEDHTALSVQKAPGEVFSWFGDKASEVFKSITGDNASEFSVLSGLKEQDIRVYFTHPYSSWEKYTNERHNGILRRVIPEGNAISDCPAEVIFFFADMANALPGRILGCQTPRETVRG